MKESAPTKKLLRKEPCYKLFAAFVEPHGNVLVHQFFPQDTILEPSQRKEVQTILSRLHELLNSSVAPILEIEFKEGRLVELTTVDPVGMPLASFLSRDLPWALGAKFALQILDALRLFHECGLFYGWVIPERLLITSDGLILPEAGTLPLYLAVRGKLNVSSLTFRRFYPEPALAPLALLCKEPRHTKMSDLFQWAVLAHRLVLGCFPFGTGSSLQIYNRMLNGKPVGIPEVIPDELLPLREEFRTFYEKGVETSQSDIDRLEEGLEILSRAVQTDAFDDRQGTLYSEQFEEILAIHEGGISADQEPIQPPISDREAQHKLMEALEKFALARSKLRRSKKTSRKWTWVMLAALLAAVLLVFPEVVLKFSGPANREYTGRLPTNSSQITHYDMQWRGGGQGHPTAVSLMESNVPVSIKEVLAKRGIPVYQTPVLLRPYLPPYRVKLQGDDISATFGFSETNRLNSIRLEGDKCCKDKVSSFVVLYDAFGAPRMLVGTDKEGRTVTKLELRK